MCSKRGLKLGERPAGRFRQLVQRATPSTRSGRRDDTDSIFNHSFARARGKDCVQHLPTEWGRRAESCSEILRPPFEH